MAHAGVSVVMCKTFGIFDVSIGHVLFKACRFVAPRSTPTNKALALSCVMSAALCFDIFQDVMAYACLGMP